MAIYKEPERADFWQLAKNSNGDYLDPWGPQDCQTHTAARGIMRANEGKKPAGITGVWPPTGGAIRKYTGDFSGGTNHKQMQTVAAQHYKTTYTPYYNLDFDVFLDMVEDTRGAGLSGGYVPLRESKFAGSETFGANHEIWVNGVDRDRHVFTYVVDPLCDGRRSLYKGPGEYPISLLREFAGDLDLGGSSIRNGLCYAVFTNPTGGAPVTPTPPSTNVEHLPMNVMDGTSVAAILAAKAAGKQTICTLNQGTIIYRGDFKTRLTTMSKTAVVPLTGYPGSGWRTVLISTGALSPTHQQQTVEAYVKLADVHPA